jgi:hypothetical protein
MRSVIAKISWLLVLLLGAEREAQRPGVAPVQPQRLLQPLLLQPQCLSQIGAQLLRRLTLVGLVVTCNTASHREPNNVPWVVPLCRRGLPLSCWCWLSWGSACDMASRSAASAWDLSSASACCCILSASCCCCDCCGEDMSITEERIASMLLMLSMEARIAFIAFIDADRVSLVMGGVEGLLLLFTWLACTRSSPPEAPPVDNSPG